MKMENECRFQAYDGHTSPEQYIKERLKKYTPLEILSGDVVMDPKIALYRVEEGLESPDIILKVLHFASEVESLLVPKLSDEELLEYVDARYSTENVLKRLLRLTSKELSRSILLELLKSGRSEIMKRDFGIDI